MTPSSLVSICIPVYNGARFLDETLRSVAVQNYPNIEIIIYNDGSTDASQNIADSFAAEKTGLKIRLFRSDRPGGLANGFRKVCAQATGKYVKLVCQDDLIAPDCVARQVAAMEENPGVALVSCRRRVIDSQKRQMLCPPGAYRKTGRYDGRALARKCLRYGANRVGEPMAVLFRKSDLEACGNFSANLTYYVDLDLWVRLLQRGDIFYIEEPLAAFRVHEASASSGIQNSVLRELPLWEGNMETLGVIGNRWWDKTARRVCVVSQSLLRGWIIRRMLREAHRMKPFALVSGR
jgi:glycosyltransferase involved in cell wall biosynthesis